VTVRGRTVAWADQIEASDRAAAQVALRLAGARLEADGVPIEQDVRVGDPVAAILSAARESGADLIVLAARGADRLVDRLRARRATTGVLQRAPVPVLLTRRGGQRVA
jgi:nucleotide-binding universal stress UspA family protein